ncbi:hypothetical protein ACTRXD_16960 [Nitrospira sp. T9]|uniref:hypothetical protein n=1 Tax=unclassified Nitrospira TaxID=2652172 RepID=UPI003F9B9F71
MDDSDNPEEVRLRRFTLIVGAIFFIYICGEVNLDSTKVTFFWLGELQLKNISVIKLIIWGMALYACSLFIYRECYLKYPPFRVRELLKKFGVLVAFLPLDERHPHAVKVDLLLRQSLKNSRSETIEEQIQEIPYVHLKDFMVFLNSEYEKDDVATKKQINYRVLERYFPFIRETHLGIEVPGQGGHGTKKVSIKTLDKKTELFSKIEDFIYFLPLLPYILSLVFLIGSSLFSLKVFHG